MTAVAPIRGPALDLVVSRLDGSKRNGQMYLCPAHDDRNPSLHVTSTDGKVLLHCFAGCEVETIVAALGLEWADIFDEPRSMERTPANGRNAAPRSERRSSPKTHRIYGDLDAVRAAAGRSAGGSVVDQYEYADESGRVVLVVFRIQPSGDGKKTFRQASPEGEGWKLSADGVRLVPFHLPELVAAVAAGDTIHVVEGEKDVLAVEAAMGVATCNPMGADKPIAPYVSHFTGADVVRIVADKDDVGRKHAKKWAEALRPIVNRIEIVEAAAGKDAADHLAAGFGLDAFVPIELDQAIPGAESAGLAHEASRYKLQRFGELRPTLGSAYLIKGLLDRGSMAVIYGASGSSKSFIALEIGMAIAAGLKWRGVRVRKGRVVYIAAEGGHGIANRLFAMQERLALGNLEAIEFYLLRETVKLTDDPADVESFVASVLEQVGPEGVDLVVIDTLSRSIAGRNENSPEHMTAAVEASDRLRQSLGCAVLIVHHSGKDEAQGARGHSSLKAALETELEVKRLGETYSLTVKKQREHADGGVWFHRLEVIEIGVDDEGDPVTTCLVRPIDDADGSKSGADPQLTAHEQRTLNALRALLAVADGTSLSAPDCASKESLREWVEKHGGVPHAQRRNVVLLGLKGLKEKRIIGIEGEKVFLAREGGR